MNSILIIEDDELFRDALASALGVRGYAVSQAADGAAGVKQFRAEPTDLIITDIVMPNQDGTATVMELRREFPRLGIIAMSGGLTNHAPVYLKIAAAFGATRTLQKPFTIPALLQAVEETLAGAGEAGPPPDHGMS
jgi:CheY-like chemotaxis protein